MKRLTLNFQGPETLNKLSSPTLKKSYYWSHASFKGFNNGILELDLTTWRIVCPEMNVDGPISEWEINEDDYTMKLKKEKFQGNFKELDFSFAVSMIGQLVHKAKLIEYLNSLKEVYNIMDSSHDALIMNYNE